MISSKLSIPSLFSILAIIVILPPLSSTSFLTSTISDALRTKEQAKISKPVCAPKIISFLSTSLINGIERFAPGTLTPFLLETLPPLITSHSISVSVIRSTFISIRPSSIKILPPTSTSFTSPLYVILQILLSPKTSFVVSVNNCPFVSSSFPLTNSFKRISGPFVSRSVATGRFNFFPIAITLSNLFLCSSWSPCEKLNLATFIPAFINSSNLSGLSLAGPIVQMIFVFLILFSSA